MNEIEALAAKIERLCKEQQIPFALFYQEKEHPIKGRATLSTPDMARMLTPYLERANTLQLSFLLQNITYQIQERCLNSK